MVDVGQKSISERLAVAEGKIYMQQSTFHLLQNGGHKKGDVLGVARIAAIMAAKKTAELIPLCHPLSLTKVSVDFDLVDKELAVCCRATVQCSGQTCVEMEALTAVNIGLLTIYDMCKAVDKGMVMGDIGLQLKSGGKSGRWQRAQEK